MQNLKRLFSATIASAAAFLPAPALADGARDWVNVPIDMNFLYAYYAYSNTDTSFDPSLPVTGASVDVNMGILRYARTLDIGGRAGGIQVVIPYAFVDATLDGTRLNLSRNGIGDIQFIFAANMMGAPALTMREFATWKPGAYLTASMAVTAPTGSYDADRFVNIGKNRWVFKPQLSWGMPVGVGGVLAVNANVQVFTNNNDAAYSRKLQQDPLWGVEGHFSQNLSRSFWLSADAFYSIGGATSVNGEWQDNGQSTLRIGASGSYNLTPVDAISLTFNSIVAKRDHTPGGQAVSINFSHGW